MVDDRERRSEQKGGLDGPTPLVPKVVQRVKTADEKLVAFVRERPLVAVGAALVLGYMVGRVVVRLD